ncbi:NAD(P)-dependent oxidoreductase, partial [Ruminococcus sp.]
MYPILIPVEGKTCLVIGAGNVAQRRIRALTEAGAAVVAAAPEQEPEALRELAVTY